MVLTIQFLETPVWIAASYAKSTAHDVRGSLRIVRQAVRIQLWRLLSENCIACQPYDIQRDPNHAITSLCELPRSVSVIAFFIKAD
jgi:hypothetical protein